MKATTKRRVWRRGLRIGGVAAITLLGLGACGHLMMMGRHDVPKPAADEFGFGPRTSSAGAYVATLEATEPLRVRRMQTVRVRVADNSDQPVNGASIRVDGGMPQHGHGLPTQPRVTRNLGDGVYEIQGVRFNMGGWWELKLAIAGPAGTDSVTFNLDL